MCAIDGNTVLHKDSRWTHPWLVIINLRLEPRRQGHCNLQQVTVLNHWWKPRCPQPCSVLIACGSTGPRADPRVLRYMLEDAPCVQPYTTLVGMIGALQMLVSPGYVSQAARTVIKPSETINDPCS